MQWLETFTRNRGLDVEGAELVAAVGDAGDRVLDDPHVLDAALAR